MTWRVASEATTYRMSRVRRRDTQPEIQVKRALRELLVDYREDDRNLPGRPDIVLPELLAVVRVHGCFWHGHTCRRGRLPATNRPLWRAKVLRNQRRDRLTARNLRALGWRVFTLWECRLRNFEAESFLARLTTVARPGAPGQRRSRSPAPAAAGQRSLSAPRRRSAPP